MPEETEASIPAEQDEERNPLVDVTSPLIQAAVEYAHAWRAMLRTDYTKKGYERVRVRRAALHDALLLAAGAYIDASNVNFRKSIAEMHHVPIERVVPLTGKGDSEVVGFAIRDDSDQPTGAYMLPHAEHLDAGKVVPNRKERRKKQ